MTIALHRDGCFLSPTYRDALDQLDLMGFRSQLFMRVDSNRVMLVFSKRHLELGTVLDADWKGYCATIEDADQMPLHGALNKIGLSVIRWAKARQAGASDSEWRVNDQPE